MGLKKCCVGGCGSTNKTHRLFSFPLNDSLRKLWLFFVVPHNSSLIGLSKEQIIDKRVCEKHFDATQFDGEGKRLRYSYPCLFTDNEIKHGVPLAPSEFVQNALSDHNYCNKQDEDEDDDDSLFIGRPGENFHEHLEYLNSQIPELLSEKNRDACPESQPSCSYVRDEGMKSSMPFSPIAACTDACSEPQPSCSYVRDEEMKSSMPFSPIAACTDACSEPQPSCSYVRDEGMNSSIPFPPIAACTESQLPRFFNLWYAAPLSLCAPFVRWRYLS